VIDIPITQF